MRKKRCLRDNGDMGIEGRTKEGILSQRYSQDMLSANKQAMRPVPEQAD